MCYVALELDCDTSVNAIACTKLRAIKPVANYSRDFGSTAHDQKRREASWMTRLKNAFWWGIVKIQRLTGCIILFPRETLLVEKLHLMKNALGHGR